MDLEVLTMDSICLRCGFRFERLLELMDDSNDYLVMLGSRLVQGLIAAQFYWAGG